MSSKNDDIRQQRIKESERAWHDAEYRAHADEAYPNTAEDFLRVYVHQHLTPFCDGGWSWWADARSEMLAMVGDVRGKRVLDYGCGYGMLGMYLSLQGAEVVGIDLSQAAVETANRAAETFGSSANFQVMDASRLEFDDETFDVVVGFGVLHHVVKYRETGSELHRVLRKGGSAYFHETLWENPIINLARRFTSVHEDAGDAPLTRDGIRRFGQNFRQTRAEERHLLYMLKRLAELPSGTPWDEPKPRPFWRWVKRTDARLLQSSRLRRYCGEIIVRFEK